MSQKIEKPVQKPAAPTQPPFGPTGLIEYDGDKHRHRVCENGSWSHWTEFSEATEDHIHVTPFGPTGPKLEQ